MLIINNNGVQGLIAPISPAELLMRPILHESGAAWWTADNADGTYPLNAMLNLRRRTEAELATPYILADVQTDKDRLNISDPTDAITFSAALTDPDGNMLPVKPEDASWIIRLRNADGKEIDAFEAAFSAGQTGNLRYTAPPNTPLGRIHLDEADFAPVSVPGIGTLQVKLTRPIEITLYRQLEAS